MRALTWGALLSLLFVGGAVAQEQSQPAQQGPPQGGQQRHRMTIPDKFTNLKVLPKDITKEQLVDTMRMFARSLDVRCEHCHVMDPKDEAKNDFASDQKPEKDVARLMMKMTGQVNSDYVSKVKLPDDPPAKQINCWTCHRSKVKPETGPPPPPARGPGGPAGPPPSGPGGMAPQGGTGPSGPPGAH